MKTYQIICLGLLPAALGVNVPNLANPDHNARATWGYTATNGPATWPSNYATCSGSRQSPIDIVAASTMAAPTSMGNIIPVGYDMEMMGTVSNNDHTIVFTYDSGVAPYIYGGRLPDGETFQFLQLHWHWGSVNTQGSEHTLDGKEYPAEVHLVHWNTKYANVSTAVQYGDGLAVLGFFYEVSSADNGNLAPMLNVITQTARKQKAINAALKYKGNRKGNKGRLAGGASASVTGSIKLAGLLPTTGIPESYYYYEGGLTTPTCDEVVLWTVFTTTVPISETQLATLRTLTDSNGVTLNDNYRPPQDLAGRTVYKRSATTTTTADVAAAQQNGVVLGSVAGAFLFAIFNALLNAGGDSQAQSSAGLSSHSRSQRVYDNQHQDPGRYYRHHVQPDPAIFSPDWFRQLFG